MPRTRIGLEIKSRIGNAYLPRCSEEVDGTTNLYFGYPWMIPGINALVIELYSFCSQTITH